MGDEYLSQMVYFVRVVVAKVISFTQHFGYVVPCLTFNEEFLEGLIFEGFHCLQENNDVAEIFFKVLRKELIHDVKY